MRSRSTFHSRLISGWLLVALAGACAVAGDGGDTFLRDLAQTRGFSLGRPVNPKVTPDGRAVLFLRAGPRQAQLGLFEFDVATGQTRELITPAQLLGGGEEQLSSEEKARRERMRVTVGGFTDFQLSPDGTSLLLSLGGRLYLLNRATGATQELAVGDGAVIDPRFSPDGRQVGFVRDSDVWVYDLAKRKARPVTRNGSELVTHGLAEFVAQEEMDRFSGWWWSPDSRFIAYEEADANGVETWHVADPSKPDAAPHTQFYPRPGKANVQARLGVIPVRGGKTRWVRWDAARYPYLARVDWHEHGGLTLLVQTRDQRELVLLRADPQTGATQTLWTEKDAAWVNLDQQVPWWLDDGSGFLWTSERNGAWQLELHDPQGALARVIVPPESGYQRLMDVDLKAGTVTYVASIDPTESQLWRVPLAGGAPVRLSQEPGIHGATFGRDRSVWLHHVTPREAAPRTDVLRADGTVLGELPSVAETPPFTPQLEIVKVGDGAGFYAKLVRPRTFAPGRRYPVLVHVYGGPHAQMVRATVNGQHLDQWIADQGFIVVSVDGRGTPGRGRDWERAIHQKFAEVPLADQVAGLEALGRRFPELDLGRVGIFGWSYGGYASALAVLRRPDVFKAGVAIASVTDWFDYDTHYTERYLGVPADAHDAVYQANSLLADAPNLRQPLLLVHGTADDNVYFRHTLKLADALFRAGKSFELLPMVGFTHMVPEPEASERLWRRAVDFFRAHLKPDAP